MADVFISYRNTPERRVFVRRLAAILRAHEISVWWDYGLEAGESYRAQITEELAKARIVAPLWCAESVVSKWVAMEAELGKDKLVPARLQKVAPPEAFESIQAADLIGWDGAVGHPRALAFVRKICERLGKPSHATTDMIEELAELRSLPLLPEIGVVSASASSVPVHDFAFWRAEWEAYKASYDPADLRPIVEHGPAYFADKARARLGEIEAERQRQAEARERQAREARLGEIEAERQRQAEARERQAREAREAEAKKPEEQKRLARERAALFESCLREPGTGKTRWFNDIDIGPEMVVVPAGSFMMGEGGEQRQVGIDAPFAIGRFTLTFAEWDAAQAHPDWHRHAGIAPRMANDHGWGRGRQPAIDVSWEDAKAYCVWLSKLTAKTYRLPSEAEWEYVCRAGTTTDFWCGDEISTAQANYNGNYTRQRTLPVDSFRPNQWGLYQVHGNVWEWCEDSYDASSRVLRGGSWIYSVENLRSANRDGSQPSDRDISVGFRIARTL